MGVTAAAYEDVFQAHRRFIWGLCYRMTGNAADADDLMQETFLTAIRNPPRRTDEPWRPWLVRVAINLSRDLLRRRRRRDYVGQWLPSPIETGEEVEAAPFEPVDPDGNPAAGYELLESVSYAFLVALEALTPTQRAVLLLRDVFDYSVIETAEALGMSQPNVKTSHHRARKAMRSYDKARTPLTRSLQHRTREVLQRFLDCLLTRDIDGAASLLAEGVRQTGDGGGEFFAARAPIVGRERVMRFYGTASRKLAEDVRFGWRMLNGLPSLIIEQAHVGPGHAPRIAMICLLDEDGRISRIHNILATRKMTGVHPLE
jgi:RNA polymerase sigma factor (sigma-70 family)